jgi:hypothetical protein
MQRRTFLAGCGGLLLAGCRPAYDLGAVSGVVKLDGDPLPRATVTFAREQGRMSVGVTDDTGRYTLRYAPGADGAEPGRHRVAITTRIDAVSAEGSLPAVEGRKELLPPRYHEKSELSAEVKRGANTIDFELTSAKK